MRCLEMGASWEALNTQTLRDVRYYLLAFGERQREQYRRTASLAAWIINGTTTRDKPVKPSDLAPEAFGLVRMGLPADIPQEEDPAYRAAMEAHRHRREYEKTLQDSHE